MIEETINIDGIIFRLIDTAGIREGAEEIEALGIERSFAKIEQASVILCMADLSRENHLEDVSNWAKKLQEKHPLKKTLIVANKADLARAARIGPRRGKAWPGARRSQTGRSGVRPRRAVRARSTTR